MRGGGPLALHATVNDGASGTYNHGKVTCIRRRSELA